MVRSPSQLVSRIWFGFLARQTLLVLGGLILLFAVERILCPGGTRFAGAVASDLALFIPPVAAWALALSLAPWPDHGRGLAWMTMLAGGVCLGVLVPSPAIGAPALEATPNSTTLAVSALTTAAGLWLSLAVVCRRLRH